MISEAIKICIKEREKIIEMIAGRKEVQQEEKAPEKEVPAPKRRVTRRAKADE